MKYELEQIRHSSAHLLAHAISELFPGTLFTIGPATDTGFFYDFLSSTTIREEDLPALEQRMREIAQRNLPIEFKTVTKAEAQELFKNNPFKLELIAQIADEFVGIATQGNFFDLCRGGHVASTGVLSGIKLLNISGVYWRGDKDKPQLQRISGVAFQTEKELEAYLKQREEALKYDHRKLGKEMDLFSFQVEGVGFPFFHPKGMIIINELKEFMRKLLQDYSYQEVSTPMMLNESLWKQSGHASYYRENMYFSTIDETVYAIKPMSCPGAFLIYNNRPRSYRELPLRLSEFGHVHRHELSGVLHGLLRVRAFTQDDAHIMCTVDQMESEIITVLKMIFITLSKIGFEQVKIAVATRPANAMGDPAAWDRATESLKSAITHSGHTFTIKEGEGAFYGPKIEFCIEDSMGRQWQCGTIQVDFVQPENFDLSCIASSGQRERIAVIHHAIFGSFERFFAILLEHYKGKLPFWLSPIQARVLTITDDERAYGDQVLTALKKERIRVDSDTSSDPLAGKIKSAQLERIPWMLVIGKKEAAAKTVTLRNFDGTQEFGLTVDELVKRARELTQ